MAKIVFGTFCKQQDAIYFSILILMILRSKKKNCLIVEHIEILNSTDDLLTVLRRVLM